MKLTIMKLTIMKSTTVILWTTLLLLLTTFFNCTTIKPVDNLPDTALMKAEALTTTAWQKLWKNEFQGAQADFVNALLEKPGYLPATRGQGLASYIQAREFDSFEKLFTVAAANPGDPLSVLLLEFLEKEIPFRKSLMERLYTHYQKLAKNNTLPYWIRRFAWDKLATYTTDYIQNYKVRKEYTTRLDNLHAWTIAGPFSNVSHSAILHDPNPEAIELVKDNPSNRIPGKNNMEITAIHVNGSYEAADGWIHLSQYLDFPLESSVYATRTFYTQKKSEYIFIISQKGALNLWLDDTQLIKDPVYKNGTDLHWIKVPLEAGSHTLVLQVSNQYDDLGFRVSMVNLDSKEIKKQADTVLVPDFSIAPSTIPGLANSLIQDPLLYYLAENLEKNPGDTETTFWISWLINQRQDGKAALELVQHELTALAAADSGAPEPAAPSLVFQYLKALSLLTANNYIDARNLLIKITDAKEIFAPASAYVIKDYLNHQHLEKAAKLIKKITTRNKGWYYALECELLLALAVNNKDETELKLKELIKRYSALYPDAPGLFSTYLSGKGTGNYYEALRDVYNRIRTSGLPLAADILEMKQAFRNDNYTRAAQLAEKVTAAHPYDINAWEYLFESRVNLSFKYDQTRALCQNLLTVFPYNRSLLKWEMGVSGNIVDYLREVKKDPNPRIDQFMVDTFLNKETTRWKDAAKQLLNIEPENFVLRNKIRDFKKKKSFTELLKAPTLDKIIADFESKEQVWKGDAVVVLDETTEFFFGQGASYSFNYYIIKILSENGVIEESTQELYYHPRNSELDIKQAFLLKPDGSTIDAVQRGNLLSYQGLQSGDYIVCLYAVNHYEPGALNNHYWSSYRFNSFYPVNETRFRLVLPNDLKVQITKHNAEQIQIEENGNTSFDGDYQFYSYSAKDLPAVTIESHLPASPDLFTWIDLTTLENWQPVVEWYEHLSTGQFEVTYKIREKTAELINGANSRDEKIRNIYDFVSQKIKYEDLLFQYSAYKPQRAETILADGYGDCKDKATLLITMLKAAGIPAYIALNTPDYAGKNSYLPSTRFNHAIVIVPGEEGAKELILDPTSEYYTYPDLPSGSIGSVYLPIKPDISELARIPEPAARGKTLLLTGIKKEGQKSIIDGSLTYNNSRAGEIRAILYTTEEDLKAKIFSSLFTYAIPGFKLDKVEYNNLYTLKEDPRIDFKASIPAPIRDYDNRLAVLELPWLIGLPGELRPAISETQRVSTFALKYDRYTDPLCQTIYYSIPENYKVLSLPKNFEYILPGGGYIRYTFELNGNQLAASRDFYLPFMDITGTELAQVKEAILRALQKEEEKIILQR